MVVGSTNTRGAGAWLLIVAVGVILLSLSLLWLMAKESPGAASMMFIPLRPEHSYNQRALAGARAHTSQPISGAPFSS